MAQTAYMLRAMVHAGLESFHNLLKIFMDGSALCEFAARYYAQVSILDQTVDDHPRLSRPARIKLGIEGNRHKRCIDLNESPG
jgi:hypothetical protein